MTRAVAIAVAVTLSAAACATTARADKNRPKIGHVQRGKATWYGAKWHGRKTASGERYNMHSMTAAHRTLPFNTVVRVTNLNNKRSVTLRINNRGPYGKGRIIDVSKAAARKLKMINAGVVPCKVRVLKLGPPNKKKKRRKKR